jgi:prevent-host-death family protein
MTITTTLSSREFNQDTAGAKKAASKGPVIITDRGQPSHVLMTYERYQALTGRQASIVSLIAMPDAAEIQFKPGRLGAAYRPAEFD